MYRTLLVEAGGKYVGEQYLDVHLRLSGRQASIPTPELSCYIRGSDALDGKYEVVASSTLVLDEKVGLKAI